MSVSYPFMWEELYSGVARDQEREGKNSALKSLQPMERQKARDKSMRKRTHHRNQRKERDPIQLGENQEKLPKGGGQKRQQGRKGALQKEWGTTNAHPISVRGPAFAITHPGGPRISEGSNRPKKRTEANFIFTPGRGQKKFWSHLVNNK